MLKGLLPRARHQLCRLQDIAGINCLQLLSVSAGTTSGGWLKIQMRWVISGAVCKVDAQLIFKSREICTVDTLRLYYSWMIVSMNMQTDIYSLCSNCEHTGCFSQLNTQVKMLPPINDVDILPANWRQCVSSLHVLNES